MFYVYILKSKRNNSLYIGLTNNLDRRLKEHNSGLFVYTNKNKPYELVYCEIYKNELDAVDREKKLKQFGKVYSQLKRRIQCSVASGKVRG